MDIRLASFYFGHSWGAAAVVQLSRKLERAGIAVALNAQIDAVAKPFGDDGMIPPNVAEAANFYQTHGLIHGRSTIRDADPKRTRIIGNFPRDYKTEPVDVVNFPGIRDSSLKGTSRSKCDPEVQSEVKTLLSAYLPHEAVAQNQPAAIPQQPVTSGGEFAEPEQRGFQV